MSGHNEGPDWFYSTNGDVTLGPVSAADIRRLVESGSVDWSHSVRHKAWDRWYSIRESAGQLGLVASIFKAPSSDPTVPIERPAPHQVRLPPPVAPLEQNIATPQPAEVAATAPTESRLPTTPIGDVTPNQRVISWAIDCAALVIVTLLVDAIFPTVLAMVLTFASFIVYLVVAPLKGYDTLGHLIVGLRVVRRENDGAADWLVLGTRAVVVLLLAAPCLLGSIASACSMFAHPRALAWHDAASGTTAIKVKPMQFARHLPLVAATQSVSDATE